MPAVKRAGVAAPLAFPAARHHIPFQTNRRNPRHAATRSTQFRPAAAGRAYLASLFLLAVPIMGANILQIAYQVIDAFWVGRLGAAAVAVRFRYHAGHVRAGRRGHGLCHRGHDADCAIYRRARSRDGRSRCSADPSDHCRGVDRAGRIGLSDAISAAPDGRRA